jgi:hypothetical protein
MTHISERVFVDDFVVPWLEGYFDPGAIETEYRLPSNRRADVFVRTPVGDFVFEAENDAGSFDVGAGQALGYAEELSRDLGVRPVPFLVVPDDHVEQPELSIAKSLLGEYQGDVIQVQAGDA